MESIVGIDVSKASIDTCHLGKDRKFSNCRKGHLELLAWAKGAGLFVMEATGSHHFALADLLAERGKAVSVVNPARAAHYARALGMKNKTDRADARVLAEYAARNDVPRYVPASPEARQLKKLVRHRERLVCSASRLRVQLQDPGVDGFEAGQFKEQAALLKSQLQAVESRVKGLLADSAELRASVALLKSIPGVGDVTAWTVLSEAEGLSRFGGAKQLAAFAGVQPRIRQSGSSTGRAMMSKKGSAALRRALFMSAVTAIRVEGPAKELFVRLVERGKARKSAVGAVMNKQARTAYGVWKSGRPFSPEKRDLTNT